MPPDTTQPEDLYALEEGKPTPIMPAAFSVNDMARELFELRCFVEYLKCVSTTYAIPETLQANETSDPQTTPAS